MIAIANQQVPLSIDFSTVYNQKYIIYNLKVIFLKVSKIEEYRSGNFDKIWKTCR